MAHLASPKLITDTPIEMVVLRVFLRVCKENGIYRNVFPYLPAGRRSVNMLRGERQEQSTPFDEAETMDEVAHVLKLLTKEHINDMPIPSVNPENKYLTAMVNHLIHFFVERGSGSIDLCNRIGEQVYNTACKTLYGEEYWRAEDEAAKHLLMPKVEDAYAESHSDDALRELLERMRENEQEEEDDSSQEALLDEVYASLSRLLDEYRQKQNH